MKRAFAVAAALGLTALAGVPLAVASTAADVAAVRPVAAATAKPKKYLGVYEKGVPGSYRPVRTFAEAMRRQPGLALYFSSWGEPFATAFADKLHAKGSMPVIQINPAGVHMSAIARGRFDAYLKSFADQVKAFGHPVVIGFAHEMNGWWYSWGWTHTSPRVWVAAWRHVVKVFRKQGARQVKWLWTINRTVRGQTAPLRRYWPGARYVSWVGIDSYYFTSKQTFKTTFVPTIATVRKITHKAILLAETSIGQKAGKARKIPDLFAGIRRYDLLGLIWYDVAQHAGRYHQDWRLEGHKAAVAVFRREVAAMLHR